MGSDETRGEPIDRSRTLTKNNTTQAGIGYKRNYANNTTTGLSKAIPQSQLGIPQEYRREGHVAQLGLYEIIVSVIPAGSKLVY